MKIIFCVDMDYFFAQIEERDNPIFKGKPLIVGADPKKGRGVVCSCNYEARKFGIKAGMPISKAYKLCKNGIFVKPRFEVYENVSKKIMEILKSYSYKFEQVSIDEAFLDLSNKVKNFDEAKNYALLIKQKIWEETCISCSIGISINKLVAKIASNFNKPDGITIVKPEDIKNFLSELPLKEIPGIGKKTQKRMESLGIKKIGDLQKYDKIKLIKEFGKLGIYYWQASNGIDSSEILENYESKSIGMEKTFEKDTQDLDYIIFELRRICEEIEKEIKLQNLWFKTITLKIRYEDFETHTHSKTLHFYSNSLKNLFSEIFLLLEPFLHRKKIRLIGLRVSNLKEMEQKSLKELITKNNN